MAAPLTLGLDLGPNSLGWALVDEANRRLVASGVRVFPEGVDRDKQGGEVSKNVQRRTARGMRRQIARRARRKRMLRRALVAAGLLPKVALCPRDDPQRVAWEREQFRIADPYVLRHKALTQRLEPHEIGRVLMHLNQRRGFLSNRKMDRAKKKEASQMLKEISTLAAEMADHRTLGQYFAKMQQADPRARLRGRHTRRDMYEREFEAIWEAQQRHHPQLLTNQLKYGTAGKQDYPREPKPPGKNRFLERYGLHGIIFFQRPMYWPKWVVGQCELEPKEKRCPRADRAAQRFRLLQEVNNLRLLDSTSGQERALNAEERTSLLAYLSGSKERKFSDIRKHLGFLENVRFNLERGDRDKLLGMPTDHALANKNLFGKDWWDRPEEQRNAIVRLLLAAQANKSKEAEFRKKATEEWGLDAATAEKVLDAELPQGHASFGRTAIAKLLPHLEDGLPLMTRDGTPSALAAAGYLRPDQRVVNQRDFLPEPPELTNPLVRQALHEVRKVVNAIIREYGKPACIRIELAREVKGTAREREQRSHEMRRREDKRDKAAEEVRKAGVKATRDAIERFLLWEEQEHKCIYSGKVISQVQLFGGEVEVEHILPYSRSLDNSLSNRALAFVTENREKGNRTPHEWLAATNPQKYEAILQRTSVSSYPYAKARKFRQPSVTLEDFFARQFVDTTYITTQVHEYVRCLGADLVCTKGQHTAELRHHWGLDTVLRELSDSPAWQEEADLRAGEKDRSDHRHHAIDAIVIALTNQSRLGQLAAIRPQGGTARTGEVLPEPWPNFRAAVVQAVKAINVSHRVRRKVSGALHEDTIYGPTAKKEPGTPIAQRPWAKRWVEQPDQFVYRKPLTALTLNEVSRIRDHALRALVEKRLAQFGLKPGRKRRPKKGSVPETEAETGRNKQIPKEVWKEPLQIGSGPPVKKVRLLKQDTSICSIRGKTALVKPGSNHHLALFEFTDHQGKTVREGLFITMLEAARRVKSGEPLIQRKHPTRPEARFLFSLSRGEAVLATINGKERLLIVRKLVAGKDIQRVVFVAHTDARPSKEMKEFAVMVKGLNVRKVTVDPLGRIRWAND